jgi:hypothetical protein
LNLAPVTRTEWISASGASERTTPAHAVPWPQKIALEVVLNDRLSVVPSVTATAP